MNQLLEALLGTLGYVGSSLDKPGATFRGLLGGQGASALANLIPFSDTMGITDPEQRMSGRGLLEHYGALDQKNADDGFGFGDILGMGVEAATDPLQWGGIAKLGSMMKGNRVARASNEVGMRSMMHNLDAQGLVAKGAMPPEVAALTKARNEAGPVATYHGTPHTFDRFEMAKMDPEALYGPGIYTTESPEIASEYAAKDAESRFVPRAERTAELQQRLDGMAERIAQIEEARAKLGLDDPRREAMFQERGQLRRDLFDEGRLLSAIKEPLDLNIEAARSHPKFGDYFEEIPATSNVRKQFLDIRNPFDIDKTFAPGEFPSIRTREWTGEEIYNLTARQLENFTTAEMPEHLRPFTGMPPNQGVNELLKQLGYDGITHQGGNLMGGGDRLHQVHIAFDPKQVYQPLVAPAMKQVPPYLNERSLSPLLAALAGENALSRTYPQGA